MCCLSTLAWHLGIANPSMWIIERTARTYLTYQLMLGEATMVLLVPQKQEDLQVPPLARDGFGYREGRHSTATWIKIEVSHSASEGNPVLKTDWSHLVAYCSRKHNMPWNSHSRALTTGHILVSGVNMALLHHFLSILVTFSLAPLSASGSLA